jgi:uncharacterized protein (DUF488 family)
MMPATTVVYTAGHSNRQLSELLALLAAADIRTLVDVRAQPTSARHPQFRMETLRAAAADKGMTYHWAGRQLGGFRAPQAGSPHTALTADWQRGFADHMKTDAFERGIAQLLNLAASSRTAILCAEKLPQDCHRALIADYLLLRGVSVRHLIEPGVTRDHELDPRARRESATLVYDRGTPGSLNLS